MTKRKMLIDAQMHCEYIIGLLCDIGVKAASPAQADELSVRAWAICYLLQAVRDDEFTRSQDYDDVMREAKMYGAREDGDVAGPSGMH